MPSEKLNLPLQISPFGGRLKPAFTAGNVRVTRLSLLHFLEKTVPYLPDDLKDTLRTIEELYQRDTVLEIGLPEGRISFAVDCRPEQEISEYGGEWLSVRLGGTGTEVPPKSEWQHLIDSEG